jgi:hypothetical protein
MRYLDLSDLKGSVVPTASSEVGKLLLRNRYRSQWPHPQASLRTLAAMVWPNDENRRNRFFDAFMARYGKIEETGCDGLHADGSLLVAGRSIQIRDLGAEVLDYFDPAIKAAQEGLRNAGDVLLTLTRINATTDSAVRREAVSTKPKCLSRPLVAGQIGSGSKRICRSIVTSRTLQQRHPCWRRPECTRRVILKVSSS